MALGKAAVAYSKAPTKEEDERLRGEGNKIKFIDFGYEGRRSEVLRFCDEEKTAMLNRLQVLGMNGDLWDIVFESGSEI